MKISQAIANMKGYHRGVSGGKPIDEGTTRDQILYGGAERELKGIVTTCYASVDVIKKAIELGANLIIAHEALFWNHGDHTDWLQENKTFQEKKHLLDAGGIVVWRDHDYVHSGIPLPDGTWTDGIFYGLMKTLGWEEHLRGDRTVPMRFSLPPATARQVGREVMEKLGLSGMKVIGDPDAPAKDLLVVCHIMGSKADNAVTQAMDEGVDTVITLECVDFTVAEYVRDSTMAGYPKTILVAGHFIAEEPGMKYMAEYANKATGSDVPVHFVPSTDMFRFI